MASQNEFIKIKKIIFTAVFGFIPILAQFIRRPFKLYLCMANEKKRNDILGLLFGSIAISAYTGGVLKEAYKSSIFAQNSGLSSFFEDIGIFEIIMDMDAPLFQEIFFAISMTMLIYTFYLGAYVWCYPKKRSTIINFDEKISDNIYLYLAIFSISSIISDVNFLLMFNQMPAMNACMNLNTQPYTDALFDKCLNSGFTILLLLFFILSEIFILVFNYINFRKLNFTIGLFRFLAGYAVCTTLRLFSNVISLGFVVLLYGFFYPEYFDVFKSYINM